MHALKPFTHKQNGISSFLKTIFIVCGLFSLSLFTDAQAQALADALPPIGDITMTPGQTLILPAFSAYGATITYTVKTGVGTTTVAPLGAVTLDTGGTLTAHAITTPVSGSMTVTPSAKLLFPVTLIPLLTVTDGVPFTVSVVANAKTPTTAFDLTGGWNTAEYATTTNTKDIVFTTGAGALVANLTYHYESSNPHVAKVDDQGKITYHNAGEAVISVWTNGGIGRDGKIYTSHRISTPVTCTKADGTAPTTPPVGAITMTVGEQKMLPLVDVNGNAYYYTTTSTEIDVIGNTVIAKTATATPAPTISYGFKATENYTESIPAANPINVTVNKPAHSLPPIGDITMTVGQSLLLPTFSSAGIPITYTAITTTTVDPSGALLLNNGTLTAKHVTTTTGSMTVEYKTVASGIYEAITATPFTVSVVENAKTPTTAFDALASWNTARYDATTTPTKDIAFASGAGALVPGLTYHYESSNPHVATVGINPAGNAAITYHNAGEAVISVWTNGGTVAASGVTYTSHRISTPVTCTKADGTAPTTPPVGAITMTVGEQKMLPLVDVNGNAYYYTTTSTEIDVIGNTVIAKTATATPAPTISYGFKATENYTESVPVGTGIAVTVNKPAHSLPTIGNITMTIGQSLILPAFSSAGIPITYTATGTSVAPVNAVTLSGGTLTAKLVTTGAMTVSYGTVASGIYEAIPGVGTPLTFTVSVVENAKTPTTAFDIPATSVSDPWNAVVYGAATPNTKQIVFSPVQIADLTYHYESSNPHVAKVSATGLITYHNAGEAVISVWTNGGTVAASGVTYTSHRISTPVKCTKATGTAPGVGDITINALSSVTLPANDANGPLRYVVSANTTAFSINNYVLTGHTATASVITVDVIADATENYNEATKAITVTVSRIAQDVPVIPVYTLKIGEKVTLPEFNTQGTRVTYALSNHSLATGVAKIEENLLTALAGGTVDITAKAAATDVYIEAVTNPTVTITVNKDAAEAIIPDIRDYYVGESLTLPAKTVKGNDITYTWTTTITNATVTITTNIVTFTSVGITDGSTLATGTITATTIATDTTEALNLDIPVRFSRREVNLKAHPIPSIKYLAGKQIQVVAETNSDKAIAYAISGDAFPTPTPTPTTPPYIDDKTGIITLNGDVKAGHATVTISVEKSDKFTGDSRTIAFDVLLGDNPSADVAFIADQTYNAAATTTLVSFLIINGNNAKLTVSSSNDQIVEIVAPNISTEGLFNVKGAGTATIKVAFAATAQYAAKDVLQPVTVKKALQTINLTAEGTALGDQTNTTLKTDSTVDLRTLIEFNEFASIPREMTFSVKEGDYAEVIGGNILHIKKATIAAPDPIKTGGITITAYTPATANYAEGTLKFPIFAKKATPILTFNPIAERIYSPNQIVPFVAKSTGTNKITFAPTSGATGALKIVPDANYATIQTSTEVGGNKDVTVTATAVGNEDYEEVTAEQVFEIAKADQMIDFTLNPSIVKMGASSVPLQATATSGLPVIASSNNNDVAHVNGKILIVNKTGFASIIASQAGNECYNAANDVSFKFTVEAAPLWISTATNAYTFNYVTHYQTEHDLGLFLKNAHGTPVNNTIVPLIVTSSDSSVVSVDANNKIKVENAGSAVVTVEARGNTSYLAAEPIKIQVTVTKGDRLVTITNTQGTTLENNRDLQMTAALTAVTGPTGAVTAIQVGGEDQPSYVWSVKDAKNGTITPNGILRANYTVGNDAIIVQVYAEATRNYNRTLEATHSVNTQKREQNISFTNLNAMTIAYGHHPIILETRSEVTESSNQSVPFTYAVTEEALDYKPSAPTPTKDEGVVKIEKNVMTVTGVGTAKITVTNPGNDVYSLKTYEVDIKVEKANDEITWDFNNPTQVQINDTSLLLTATTKSGKDVSFAVSYHDSYTGPNKDVADATKAADGKWYLGFKNVGEAYVTATSDDHPFYEKTSLVKNLIVSKTSRWIDFKDPMLGFNNPTAPVIHTYDDGPVQLNAISYSRNFTTNAPHVDNNTEIQFRSSNPNIATINENGEMVIHGAGTVFITAYQANIDEHYDVPAEVSRVVVINKAPVTLAWTDYNATLAVLESIPLNATSTSNISHNSTNPTCSISYKITEGEDKAYFVDFQNNKVYPYSTEGRFYGYKATAPGKVVTVKVSTMGNENYEASEKDFSIAISQANQTVEFDDSTKTQFTFGDAPHAMTAKAFETRTGFDCKQEYPARAITYSIENEKYNGQIAAVANVDATTGIVTFLQSGTFDLVATQENDLSFNTATATQTITVNRAKQEITQKSIDDVQTKLNGLYTQDAFDVNLEINEIANAQQGKNEYTNVSPDVIVIDIDNLKVIAVGNASLTVNLAETAHYEKSENVTFAFRTFGAKIVTADADGVVYAQPYGVGTGTGEDADNATGLLDVAMNAIGNNVEKIIATEGEFAEEVVNVGGYSVNKEFNIKDGLTFEGGKAPVHAWATILVRRAGYTTLNAKANDATHPINKSVAVIKSIGAFTNATIIKGVHFMNGYHTRRGGENQSDVAALEIVGNMYVTNCYFENNYADLDRGSVVKILGGHILNSVFSYNTSGSGVVRFGDNTGGSVVNCVFIKNSNPINNYANRPTIVNNTFVKNEGTVVKSEKPIILYNSILYNNEIQFSGAVLAKYSAMDQVISNDSTINCNTFLNSNSASTMRTDFDNVSPNFTSNTLDELKNLALNQSSVLINRGNESILEDALKVFNPTAVDTTLDILGEKRIQKGFVDLGAFESNEKGWTNIIPREQQVEYGVMNQVYTNFSIQPTWNAEQTQNVKVEYSKDNATWTSTATEASEYAVRLTAYTATPENENWNESIVTTLDGLVYEITQKGSELIWSTPHIVEWEKKPYQMNIDCDNVYTGEGGGLNHGDYTITYSALSDSLFTGTYETFTETYVKGILKNEEETKRPTEVGCYKVVFENTNPNYNIQDTSIFLEIRSKTVNDDDITITDLNHFYDMTTKDVSISFSGALTPATPKRSYSKEDRVDYWVNFYDAKDPSRKILELPLSVGEYTVEVVMAGTDSRFAGRFNGRFIRTMKIVSVDEDPYAHHIPVQLVLGDMPTTIDYKGDGTDEMAVSVLALERTPVKGQRIILNVSWSLSNHLFTTSESKEIVFDGTSKHVKTKVKVNVPNSMRAARYVKFELSQFGMGADATTGLNLRAVTPKVHTVEVNRKDTLPDPDYKLTKLGFYTAQTMVKGTQPVSISFYVPKENATIKEVEFMIKHPKGFAPKSVIGGADYVIIAGKENSTSKAYTYKAKSGGSLKVGYHQITLNLPEFEGPFDGIKLYALKIVKAQYTHLGKIKNVPKGITSHAITVENNNPNVDTLVARFVQEKGVPDVNLIRFIAIFGEDEELEDIDSSRIDIIDGVELSAKIGEAQLGRRTLSLSLSADDVPPSRVTTKQGAIILPLSGRIFGYYVAKDKAERGYVDTIECYVRQADGGQTKTILNIYVGPRAGVGSIVNIPKALFGMKSDFVKKPTMYGLYFKPFAKYKVGKKQKETKISLKPITKVSKKIPQSSIDYKIVGKAIMYNTKTMKVNDSFILDALSADESHKAMQYDRLGLKIEGKLDKVVMRDENKLSYIIVPPTVSSVSMGNSHVYVDFKHTSQYTKAPVLIVRGENFSDKPIVSVQYFDIKRNRFVKVKGMAMYAKPSSKRQYIIDNDGTQYDIPAESKVVENGYVVIKFPKSIVLEKLFDKASDNGVDAPRLDVIVESKSGFGGAKDVMKSSVLADTLN